MPKLWKREQKPSDVQLDERFEMEGDVSLEKTLSDVGPVAFGEVHGAVQRGDVKHFEFVKAAVGLVDEGVELIRMQLELEP